MTTVSDLLRGDPAPREQGSMSHQEPAAPAWTRWVAVFVASTSLCVWMGHFVMFNYFGPWDDEGYNLIALRAFVHHGGLYTHVYSQYGPFFYEIFSLVFTWLPVTIDSGRIVTLIVLVLTSLGLGVAITLFTRSVIAGGITELASFLLLTSFDSESMHASLVVCLMSSVACIALALIARGRRSAGFILLGVAVVAVLLTQVNAGVFAIIAMLFAGLMLIPLSRGMRLVPILATVLFVIAPFLLVEVASNGRPHFWAVKYALIVTLSAGAVAATVGDVRIQGLVRRRDALSVFLGGGVVFVVVVVVALLSGTLPVDLVRGVVIAPTHQADSYVVPLYLSPWIELWGAVWLAVAVWYRRRSQIRSEEAHWLTGLARIVVGLVIIYSALEARSTLHLPVHLSFTVALPLLFVAAMPSLPSTESESAARVALVSLATLEALLAYPVAGAQISWSSLLIVPVGMLCFHDGVRQLRTQTPLSGRQKYVRGVVGAASVAILGSLTLLIFDFFGYLSIQSGAYNSGVSLALPGSGLVRLPKVQAVSLESISRSIRNNCSEFVTLPGMDSFYFWTSEDAPTSFNATAWFSLVGATQQEQTVHQIERHVQSHFCVVYNSGLLSLWLQGRPIPQLPLVRRIASFDRLNEPPIQLQGGYQLFVSRAH